MFSVSCIFFSCLIRLDPVPSTHHVLNGIKTAILLTTRSWGFIFNIFLSVLLHPQLGSYRAHLPREVPESRTLIDQHFLLVVVSLSLKTACNTHTQLMKRERKLDHASLKAPVLHGLSGGIYSRVPFISLRPAPLGRQHYPLWINHSYWVLWI